MLRHVLHEHELLPGLHGEAQEGVEGGSGILSSLEEEPGEQHDEVGHETGFVYFGDELGLQRGVGLALSVAEHDAAHLAQVLCAALLILRRRRGETFGGGWEGGF